MSKKALLKLFEVSGSFVCRNGDIRWHKVSAWETTCKFLPGNVAGTPY